MFGIFSKTLDSNFIEAAGYSGLDFIILDHQHGPTSIETLQNHVRAARLTNMKSIVRVSGNNPNSIGAALDTGADGVQIPNISSFEEAKNAVKAARFYPHGMRGVCRFVNAAKYGIMDRKEYFRVANTKTVILQVEGKDGIEQLDEILGIESFDVLFIGPYDLSQSAGYPGEIDHPEVVALIERIALAVKKSGKTLGTFADTIETAIKLKKSGFQYIAYSLDIALFAEKLISIKELLK